MTPPAAAAGSPREEPVVGREPGPRNPLVRLGHVVFRRRKLLFPLIIVPVTFGTTRGLLVGGDRLDAWLDVAGFVVALAGQTLRALTIGLVYIQRGGAGGKIHAGSLVRGGLFAHSRNPLYLGNLLIVLGMFLVLNSLPGYLIGLPLFLVAYLSLVLAEEDYLRRTFGAEYEDYFREVNRFLPSLRGLRSTITGMRFQWKRLVRKEYGATFAGATWLLIELLWSSAVRYGFLATRPMWSGLLAFWTFLLLAYGTARYLKKTKRLRTP